MKSKSSGRTKSKNREGLSPAEYGRSRIPPISKQRVLTLIHSGRMEGAYIKTDNGRYRIDNVKADKAIVETQNLMHSVRADDPTSKSGGSGKVDISPAERQKVIDTAGFGDLSFADAQTEDKRWSAALKKLDFDEKRGALIECDRVADDATIAGKLIKEKLLAIPGRLGAMAAAEPDPFTCEQMLKVEINQILEDLSIELAKYA